MFVTLEKVKQEIVIRLYVGEAEAFASYLLPRTIEDDCPLAFDVLTETLDVASKAMAADTEEWRDGKSSRV